MTGGKVDEIFQDEIRAEEDEGDYNSSGKGAAKDATSDLEMLKRRFAYVVMTLTEREQRILTLRYGLDGRTPYTFREIGKELGITRERIRQIEEKGIRKLRHPFRKEYLSVDAEIPDVLELLTGQDLTSVMPDKEEFEIWYAKRRAFFALERVESLSDITPIYELVSLRTLYSLKRAGINTVGDLCNRTYDDLISVRSLGRRELKVLEELRILCLSLRKGSQIENKNTVGTKSGGRSPKERIEKYKLPAEVHEKKIEGREAGHDNNANLAPNDNKEELDQQPRGVQKGFKYCRNCGNKLPDTAKFCDRCGEEMDY